MALTKVGGDIIRQPLDIGSLNATTVQIGAATTVHTTGIDVGSGSVTGHNIHSTGIVTATSFVGPVTGNVTGNLTGNVTGNADTASNLTGSPSITVTNITAAGNVSIAGTLTYEDVTNIDSVGIVTARDAIVISEDNAIHFRGTAADDADAILRASAGGGQLLINSRNDAIINIDSNNDSTDAHFAVAHGAATGSSTELFRVQENGNVGINKNAPTSVLDVRQTNTGAATEIKLFNLDQSNATTQTAALVMTPDVRANGVKIVAVKEVADMSSSANKDLALTFQTVANNTAAERLRITSDGKFGLGLTPSMFFEVYSQNENDIARFSGPNSGNIVFRNDTSNEIQIHTGTSDALIFGTNGENERLRITSAGDVVIGNSSAADGAHFQHYQSAARHQSFQSTNGDLAIVTDNNSNPAAYIKGTGTADLLKVVDGSTTVFTIKDGGLVNIGGAQFTTNTTPSSGRGVEIFQAGTGVGQIASFNRDGNGWDELRIKGSELKLYAGTTNTLTLNLQSTQSTLYGTSDGILNLDTTDQRGAFIRFKENGTSKGWAGCSEGIGTGGDQDDFGIRAVGGFRLRTGTNNSIEITDEGQIALRPMTGGFTTQGAQHTYPGAAVSIQCNGVGPGTGTNIPQYGLYVDAAQSSNDATLMTGIYAIAKQNVEGSAIGIHGLYYRDWNSYARKIGGLFQAPARASRYVTKSFNPGGGMFANTTSTGHANALASGGPQPDGTTPTSATYGDVTALWGDTFKSDTDTSTNADSIAIKATNRVTHGRNRTGLMVGIVDGNDTTYNRRKTQFVEYYANSTYQRYYRRNEIKDVTEHYPMSINSTSGVKNPLQSTHTAIYHYQRYVGYNQYSWYFFNAKGSTSARCGRVNLDVTWTTGHAAGVGFGKYDILYRAHHGNSTIQVADFVKYHEDNMNGSYYGWSSAPNVDVYGSTSTGDNAGFYLRVQGHINANGGTYDGYAIQSFRLVSLESDYNFTTECSFRFVGNSTPSDANGSAESRQSPNG